MYRLIIIILMLSIAGCALHPAVPYDPAEKILLGTAIAGQVWDYTSTKNGLDNGCIETNQILGEHPSDAALAGSKIMVMGVAYFGANAIDNHTIRKIYLGIISAIGLAAGAHNSQVDCK